MTPLALVVDPDVDTAIRLVSVMESQGFNVLIAGDGEAAVELAQSHPIDLITIEMELPTFDGVEAVRRIREFSDAAIVFVSSDPSESAVIEGLGAGADSYLTKPFKPYALRARLEAVMRRRETAVYRPAERPRGPSTPPSGAQVVAPQNPVAPVPLSEPTASHSPLTPAPLPAEVSSEPEPIQAVARHLNPVPHQPESSPSAPAEPPVEAEQTAEVMHFPARPVPAEHDSGTDSGTEIAPPVPTPVDDSQSNDDADVPTAEFTISTPALTVVDEDIAPVESQTPSPELLPVVVVRGLELDPNAGTVIAEGKALALPKAGIDLLYTVLSGQVRRVHSLSELAHRINGGESPTEADRRTVQSVMDSAVSVLETVGDSRRWIEKIPAVGYRRASR